MRSTQYSARWFLKIHRRLIKPPYPVLIRCPGCGHGFIEVNADVIEISNDFGLPAKELKAVDVWQRIKHSCGALVVVYWKA